MTAQNKLKKNSPRFTQGSEIILDQAEYEVLVVGTVHWEGQEYKDSYALWDKDGYGRIETIKYVDKNANKETRDSDGL